MAMLHSDARGAARAAETLELAHRILDVLDNPPDGTHISDSPVFGEAGETMCGLNCDTRHTITGRTSDDRATRATCEDCLGIDDGLSRWFFGTHTPDTKAAYEAAIERAIMRRHAAHNRAWATRRIKAEERLTA